MNGSAVAISIKCRMRRASGPAIAGASCTGTSTASPQRSLLTPNVRTHERMKRILSALLAGFISFSATAKLTDSPPYHPLYGQWMWTYAKNNCREVYHYRPDNTSVVSSGEEIGESRFTISEKPDSNGFYRMTDVITKSNGLAGCDGTPGGTPVGDTVTLYILFSPSKSEMIVCQEPSLKACMGPLRRVSE